MSSRLQPCPTLMNIKCISIYSMMRRATFIFILITLGFCGCDKKTSAVLPPNKFAVIYVDILLSKASVKSADSLPESPDIETLDKVFHRHNVTKEQIQSTIDNYNNNVSKWKEFYSIVTNELEKYKKRLSEESMAIPAPSSE